MYLIAHCVLIWDCTDTTSEHWNHVRSEENPVDLISHGTSSRQLQNSELRWSGPKWLQERRPEKESNLVLSDEILEMVEIEKR